jgi:hypothetical protein
VQSEGGAVVFERFSRTLKRDRQLIINCDKTHVSSVNHFKVLTKSVDLPLKTIHEKIQHVPAMCAMTADGDAFRPMFVHIVDQADQGG